MKRSQKYKLASLVLLGGVLIAFNQCVAPGQGSKSSLKFNDSSSSSNASTNITVSKSDAMAAYSKTVYTVSRARCISCHATSQTPLHASSDITTAYDAVMNTSKIDINNPSNSRLVLKLRNDHHNCWGTCSDNADEMESQITAFKKLISGTSTTTTTSYGITTSETSTIDEALNPTGEYDDNSIHLSASSASLKSPMAVATDGTNTYIASTVSKSFDLNSTDYGAGYLNFTVPLSDFYHVYMYVNTGTDATAGLYVKVAGSDYKDWTIGATNGFSWVELTNTTQKIDTDFYIQTNKSNILEIRQKTANVKIANVVITNDVSYDPTSTPKAKAVATLSVSLDSILPSAGASFEIDIEDFDQYSYKVSAPRIKTSKNLTVKNLKILVNGSYNPQHATYTTVSKTITTTDSSLSTASMILLKDKGNVSDKLSFAFGTLELAK